MPVSPRKYHFAPRVLNELTIEPHAQNEDLALALVQPLHEGSTVSAKETDDAHIKMVAEIYLTRVAEVYTRQSKDRGSRTQTARTFVSPASLRSDDIQEHVIDDRASASTASLGQRFNLALSARNDTDRLLKT